jgi:glutathione S-transferase
MHSGFMALRKECSMNIRRRVHVKPLSADAKANAERVQEIWASCRMRYGQGGPFLFSAFSGADAMFAPVVHRFRTYGVDVAPEAAAYMQAMQAHPAFQEWNTAAANETWVIEKFETD